MASRVPPGVGTFSSFLPNRIDVDGDAFIQCSACSVWPSLQVLVSPQSQRDMPVGWESCQGCSTLTPPFSPVPACFPSTPRNHVGSRATWAF